jgi:hypothetical protein
MGIRAGYTVERRDGVRGIVLETRAVEPDAEPCFATVEWPDGKRTERLRDLMSTPPVGEAREHRADPEEMARP